MKLNFFPTIVDKTSMNHQFMETLIELSNKDPETEVQFANHRMAFVVEFYMRQMEEAGTPITRENLLKTFYDALEIYKKIEEHEKNSKTA